VRLIKSKSKSDTRISFNERMIEKSVLGSRVFEDSEKMLKDAIGFYSPRYSYDKLLRIYKSSSAIKPNVDIYKTNIEGLGFSIVASMDLDYEEVIEVVRDELGYRGGKEIVDEELEAHVSLLERQQRREKIKARRIADSLVGDESFTDMRKKTREDMEVLGNGFWQMVRNKVGNLERWYHYPAYNVRLMPIINEVVEINIKKERRIGTLKLVKEKKMFRSFYDLSNRMYFKEYRDPRVMSRLTGKLFKNNKAFLKAIKNNKLPKDDKPASELKHFAEYFPDNNPNGMPRFLYALPQVLGKRASAEVNKEFFENKVLPALAIIVNNGELSDDSIDRIEEYLEEKIKGIDNYHAALILEATPSAGTLLDNTPKATLDIKQIQQPKDAQFRGYEDDCSKTVDSIYRTPMLLKGGVEKITRDTAETIIRYVEDQVFSPERETRDFFINSVLRNEFAISLAKFVTNSSITKDSKKISDMLATLVDASIILPSEARKIATDIFNKPFKTLDDKAWTRIPPKMIQYLINYQKNQEATLDDIDKTLENVDGDFKERDINE